MEYHYCTTLRKIREYWSRARASNEYFVLPNYKVGCFFFFDHGAQNLKFFHTMFFYDEREFITELTRGFD